MNKRIQKKLQKRLEHDAEQLANEAVAVTGERSGAREAGAARGRSARGARTRR